MGKGKRASVDDLFDLFEEVLDPEDIVASKLIAEAASALTAERIRQKMTQQDLADLIGSTQSEISRWERGDYNFSMKSLAKATVALGLEVNLSFHNNVIREPGVASFAEKHVFRKTIIYTGASKNKANFKTYASTGVQSVQGGIHASIC